MHILLVHQLFLRVDEAGMTQHYEYARHLVRAGHRVTVLAGRRSYMTGQEVATTRRQFVEPGLEVIPCAQSGRVHRSFAWRTLGFLSFMFSALAAGLRVRQVDVVWTTSPPLPQVCTAWALARLKRRPLVFEVRDLWPAVAVEMGVLRSRPLIAVAEAAEGFLYRAARVILVNSPGFLTHLAGRGVPAEKVQVVPNGVDLEAFDPKASGGGLRAAYGLEGKFIALYAGAHGMANDLMTLLRAAQELRREQDIVFVLAGDGKEKPCLTAAAADMGLANVVFLPAVPKAELARILAASDCSVALLKPIPLFASVYPNKVFDAMAAGRPIVLAIGGVIRELVEAAGAGLTVPPGHAAALAEAVRRLARDRPEARRMGERGRALVEARFDRRQSAERLEQIFYEVVDR